MKYKTIFFFRSVLYIGLFLSSIQFSNAQTVIQTPTFPFTQICANPTFNTFSVTIAFSPAASFTSSNQFIVELSDASGSFLTNSTIVYTSEPGAIKNSPGIISFSVPTTIAGEKFRLRVRSTSPSLTSANSRAFAAYYKPQDRQFSINNFKSTAVYCKGGSYTLTIDNPGQGTNDSPLKYPSLTYKWFKETGPTTSDFVSEDSSLTVNSPGTYFVATNYGTCTSDSVSNRVTVSESSSSGVLTGNIVSSLGNPFCNENTSTILSGPTGQSYQWSQDGSPIIGATQQTYQTDSPGVYSVVVKNGSCDTSATIDLKTEGVTSSFNLPKTNVIQPNVPLTATVTSTAIDLTYEWTLNGTVISGATSNTYEITQKGDYKVNVKNTSGCNYNKEYAFSVEDASLPPDPPTPFPDVDKIPSLISPNGDGTNDTWIIPLEYTSKVTNPAEIMILSSQGEIVFKTNSYENNWPEEGLNFKSVYPVYYYVITTSDNKVKRGSITVVK